MRKIISFVAVAGLAIFLAGCSYQTTVDKKNVNQPTPVVDNNQNVEQPVAQVDEYQGWSSFSNPTGGYSFKYSPTWSVAINQYSNKNSLFGVGATSQSGKGGVEVSSYTGTLEAYLNNMEQNAEVKYLARENVTINGVSGIRTNHEGFPVSGYSVLLKKGDQIFNIYTNSKETNDVKLFDKLVASFVFSNSINNSQLQENLSEAEKYCISKGGKIEIEEREGEKIKICFINDGLDGMRCRVDLYYEKKCGR